LVSGRRERGPAEIDAALRGAIEESLAELGLELDALDLTQAGTRKIVKVVVDAERDVALDEVAGASRALSRALDDADVEISGSYTLEVTSPGLERPLRLPRHWRRAYGRLVRLTTADGSTHSARVGRAGEHGVDLLSGGSLRGTPYAEIQRAVVEVEFKPPSERELASLEQDATNRARQATPGPNAKEDPE
jgi:ribosome maturation factor RimP